MFYVVEYRYIGTKAKTGEIAHDKWIHDYIAIRTDRYSNEDGWMNSDDFLREGAEIERTLWNTTVAFEAESFDAAVKFVDRKYGVLEREDIGSHRFRRFDLDEAVKATFAMPETVE